MMNTHNPSVQEAVTGATATTGTVDGCQCGSKRVYGSRSTAFPVTRQARESRVIIERTCLLSCYDS
jgi:hypothetical protein